MSAKEQKTPQSIRTILARGYTLLVIAPILFIGLVLVWWSYNQQEAQALELRKVHAREAAGEISYLINEIVHQLGFGAKLSFLLKQNRVAQYETLSIMRSMRDLKGKSVIEALGLMDKDGNLLAGTSRTDIFTEEYIFAEGLADMSLINTKEAQARFSEVFYDGASGEPLLDMLVPLISPETAKVEAWLSARLRLRNIWRFNQIEDDSVEAVEFIVDHSGRVISHPDQSVVLKGLVLKKPGVSGVRKGLFGGTAVLASVSLPIGERELYVISQMPLTSAMALTIGTIYTILILLALDMAAAVLLGAYVMKKIIRPIESLSELATSVSRGELEKKAVPENTQELGVLAVTFNEMTSNLVNSIERLTAEVLERKSAEVRLKKANEFLNSLLASLSHPFYVVDVRDFTVVMANPAAGFGDYPKNAKCYALSHRRTSPCDGKNVICPVLEIKRTGKPVKLEHEHYDRDGKMKIHEVYGYPIFDDIGNVVQIIEYSIDITERKIREQELLRANNLEAIGRLAAGIAHEVNNPLTNASLAIQMLQSKKYESEIGDKALKKLQSVENNIEKASKIAGELLRFSRKSEPQYMPVDLSMVLQSALVLLGYRLGNITVHRDCQESVEVLGNVIELEQAFINIIENSIEAMPDGGLLDVRIIDCGENAHIEIRDTGVGLTDDVRLKVFEPFFTTKRVGEGTGLGLAICYGIIHRHGGGIDIEGLQNGGAKVQISLPLNKEEQ